METLDKLRNLITKRKLTPVRLLSLGYLITILTGTILLMLPIASKEGTMTSLVDCLFVSTSATCVTGLIPFDTFSHWTMFGQIVILVLIQIGGLGFMTIITLIMSLFKRNIGLYNRTVLMQSAGSYNISQIGKLLTRILIGTLLFETLGAVILYKEFSKTMENSQAIYYGIFHSISAFCNAGFDILGNPLGSLCGYYDNAVVLFTIMLLIIIGGLGFIVWSDLLDSRFKWKKIQMHTKIVLVFNSVLILIPAVLFLIFEFTGFGQEGAYQNMNFFDKLVNALFLSVSPRTAGFNTLNLGELTSSGKLLTIILMFIGGNSGSTAGGVKVTTFIVVMANLLATARGRERIVMFKRTIPDKIVKQSSSLFIAYLIFVFIATLIISAVETVTFEQVLFEVVSAIGTVGLSLGLSAVASPFTKIVLILLMYAGRLGALTLFSLFVKEKNDEILIEPKGKILVG